MSNYPNSTPTFPIPVTGNKMNNPNHITQHTQEDGEILAIIAELGYLPKGSDATVRARLDRIDSVSITTSGGNITGNLSGSVGSVTGAVTITADQKVNVDQWNAGALPTFPTVDGNGAIPANVKYVLGTLYAGKAGYLVDLGQVANPTTTLNLSGLTVGTTTTLTNMPTVYTPAQIATGIFQDTTTGDFTKAGSFGIGIYTGLAPGGAGGLATVGSAMGDSAGVTTLLSRISGNVALAASLPGHLSALVIDGSGNLTANITGSLSGSVGSVTGAVGSVSGSVGSMADKGASLTSMGDTRLGYLTGNVATAAGLTTVDGHVLAIPTNPYTGTPPTTGAIATAVAAAILKTPGNLLYTDANGYTVLTSDWNAAKTAAQKADVQIIVPR